MSGKRHQDPKWAESQVLTLNYDCALAEFVGGQGLSDRELAELPPEPAALERELTAGRQDGRPGFLDLPYQSEVPGEIRRVAKPVLEWCWDFVVLGIGGSPQGFLSA
ncbi:MAG: hypothetical protein ACLQED_08320 [Desulfobaccales bacterium]